MRTKILFVISSLGDGGAEHSLINLLEALSPEAYDLNLLTFAGEGSLMQQVPQYVRCIQPPKELVFLTASSRSRKLRSLTVKGGVGQLCFILHKRKHPKLSNYLMNQQKWEKAYKPAVPVLKEKFDVAVAFMHSLPTYYVLDKVKAERKIAWMHHDYQDYMGGKEFDAAYFSKLDSVVTVSERCRSVLQEAFPECAGRFLCLMNINSVASIRRRADEFFPEEYKDKKEVHIVSIGRLVSQKRFDRAVEASRILRQRGLAFSWFILGDGELRQKLQDMIEEYRLQDTVHLIGVKENPYPYIKHADVVVQCSDTEGKSMVLDEAKILCKPIISTDYLTVYDQLEDRVTGLIVQKDEKAIADAIESLMNYSEQRRAIIRNLENLPDEMTEHIKKYHELFGK